MVSKIASRTFYTVGLHKPHLFKLEVESRTDDDLAIIMGKLNNRPRKSLK